METNFTPGPWVCLVDDDRILATTSGITIAKTIVLRSGADAYNAALIAASPDLYAAVAARVKLRDAMKKGHVDAYYDSIVMNMENSALKKARGE